jgi:PAS domain S-box-containing protein
MTKATGVVDPAVAVTNAPFPDDEIDFQKLHMFFQNAIAAQLIFILVATLLLYYVGRTGLPVWLVSWWFLAVSVAVIRLALAKRFLNTTRQPSGGMARWRAYAVVGAGVAGLVWAAGGVAFMRHDPGETRVFFTMIMNGMAAGAVATLSSLPAAFRMFALPVLLAIFLTALFDAHGPQDYMLAFVITLLALILLRSARNIHDNLDESLRGELRMRLLAERLEAMTGALGSSEARLSMLLDHDPSAIFLVAPEGGIVYTNPQARTLLGQDADALLGLRLADMLRGPWEGASTGLSPGQRYLARADGSEVVVEVRTVALPDGNTLWAVGDITDRKRIEAELERHRHHLEDLVEQRTTALLGATERAERLARVKGEFLANMSHELRTPLNGVLGFAELGKRSSDAAGRTRHHFENIIKSGRLLLKVINDILDFSKSEAGQLKTESVPYALAEVLREAVDMSREQARAKGLKLTLDMAADLPKTVVGDPYRLMQVLGNLLDNAVKFTETGSVELSARLEGDRLVLQVRDTGIGMAEASIAELFQPFTQADSSTSRKYGGTGLGLSICKRLVELMQGELRVESVLGAGSLFEIRLPTRVPSGDSLLDDGEAAPTQSGRLAGLTMLVAEDNEINRIMLDEMLRNEGVEATLAVDGAEAVECVHDHGQGHFDIVLMDVQMPILNGLDATRLIHEIDPGLPVLGQSAHALSEDREKCIDAGMVEQMTKPIDLEGLVAMIERFARRRINI